MNSRSIAAALLLNIPTVSNFALTHGERSLSWSKIRTDACERYNAEYGGVIHEKDEPEVEIEDEKKAEYFFDEKDCCWKSAANRLVRLEHTKINLLCDAERETLKALAVQKLQNEGFTNITIPKEKRVSPISRWRALLPLIRKYKGLPDAKNTPTVVEPQKPVFAIDLCQAIENEKASDRAHEIAMAKSDLALTAEDSKEAITRQENEKKLSKSYYERRSSDPLMKLNIDYNGEKPVIYVENCANRKHAPDSDNHDQHRISRLIEALCLSSTSASSVCVLNRECEFRSSTPQVPKVMRHTGDFILKHGLHSVHIFRCEGSKSRVKKMREEYDNGCEKVIMDTSNPYDVAALFKDFIRKLPEPLMTRELYSSFLNVGKVEDKELYHKLLKLLILLLPVPNRDTLEVVLKCLRQVADQSEDKCDDDGNVVVPGNKMDAHNIAICMAPNILYRYKGYKSTNPFDIEEENNTTIEIVKSLIQLTHELFVIEKEIYDEVLKTLLETDPETVDYVLRKKSTRTTFSDMLKSFDDSNNHKDHMLRPSSLKVRKSSNREQESDLKKTHSFGSYEKGARRHTSTVTRPDVSRLESPDESSLHKFSRNIFRKSLGSRDGRSKSYDSKLSPRSSPHTSKRSMFRRDKNNSNNSSELHDLEGSIPENNRLTCECTTSRSTSASQERIKMTPPVKDRRRKISLPTFLQSSANMERKHSPLFPPRKTPSVEIEVFVSPTESSPPIGKICESSDDFISDTDSPNNNNNNDDNNNNDSSCEERNMRQFDSKKIKAQRSIDWSSNEDWPKWQLEVVSSSGVFTSPETTL